MLYKSFYTLFKSINFKNKYKNQLFFKNIFNFVSYMYAENVMMH